MNEEHQAQAAGSAPRKTNWLKVLGIGALLAYPVTYGAMWGLGALPYQREQTAASPRVVEQEPSHPPTGLSLEQEAAVADMCLKRTLREFGEINYWADGTGTGKVGKTLNDFGYITWVADIARLGPDGSAIEDAASVRCDVSPDNLGSIADLEISR